MAWMPEGKFTGLCPIGAKDVCPRRRRPRNGALLLPAYGPDQSYAHDPLRSF